MKNILLITFLVLGILRSHAQSSSNCIAPNAPSAITKIRVCQDQMTTVLTASGLGTLSWYDASTGGKRLGQGSNYNLNTENLIDNITLYVQDSTCTISNSRTAVMVILDKMPDILSITGKNTICTDSINLKLTSTVSSTISWYLDGYPVFSGLNEVTIKKLNTKSNYTITARTSNGVCPAISSTLEITRLFDNTCSGANDIAKSAAVITNNAVILGNVVDYKQGRSVISNCSTSSIEVNAIDAFYTFIADNNSVSLNLNVDNPGWESSMELIDTTNYTSISNQCINTIGAGQTERTYTFTALTVGQKYEVRLELGSTSPLGHARIAGAGSTFSVRRAGTTGIEDEVHLSNKEIFKIYNIQGQEVSRNYPGLVIYKFTDGTSQKVVQE